MPPDASKSLLDLQRSVARELRDWPSPGAAPPRHDTPTVPGVSIVGWEIYRNNARQFFHGALAATYPVLLRRVGEDYFRQLAREYRTGHPSRSGDLHWVGRDFPDWLQTRFAGTPYAWLSDLARLEWACEEAFVAPHCPALGLDSLAAIPPERLDRLVIGFQPSMRLVASSYAVWSVWQANQADGPGPAIDVASGPEHCVCACVDGRVAVHRLDADGFALLTALQRGENLAHALAGAAVAADLLASLLGWAFGERLVTALNPLRG